MGRWNFMSA